MYNNSYSLHLGVVRFVYFHFKDGRFVSIFLTVCNYFMADFYDFYDFLAKIIKKVNIRLLYFTLVTHSGRYEMASQVTESFF